MKQSCYALIGLCLLATLAGCGISSEGGGRIELTRRDGGEVLGQKFNQAYVARGESGDYNVILVHDGLADADLDSGPGASVRAATSRQQRGGDEAASLQPVDRVPVQHIVHLRVFYRPMRGARSDDPASTNAAIDWYVVTHGTRAGEDVLKYKGAGFVALYPGDDGASVAMRNIHLRPELVRGNMTDPIGPATLRGSATAVWDKAHVENVLAELKQRAMIASR